MGTKSRKNLRKTTTEKIPAHRPAEFEHRFCGMLILHMSKGFSFESFAGRPDILVDRVTLYNWAERYPEFLYAKNVGKEAQRHALEDNFDQGLNGLIPGYQTTGAIFRLKNMANWKDKTEVESKNENTNKLEITFVEK